MWLTSPVISRYRHRTDRISQEPRCGKLRSRGITRASRRVPETRARAGEAPECSNTRESSKEVKGRMRAGETERTILASSPEVVGCPGGDTVTVIDRCKASPARLTVTAVRRRTASRADTSETETMSVFARTGPKSRYTHPATLTTALGVSGPRPRNRERR